jgi:hypothetical protein
MALGLAYFTGLEDLITAMGDTTQQGLQLDVQLLSSENTLIGPQVRVDGVIIPRRLEGGADRLSGMFVRKALFTGTAPEETGTLYCAMTKRKMLS